MILSQRVNHSASRSISYPISSELAPDVSSQPLRTTPQRGHKHTLSRPIWLGRNSSSLNPAPYAAPKPTRISEPKVGSSLEQFNFQRSGPLGSGATVVRTPQEALFGSFGASEQIDEEDSEGVKEDVPSPDTEKDNNSLVPPPRSSSPPLPPLPDTSDEQAAKVSGTLTSTPLADQVPQRGSSSSKSSGMHGFFSTPTLVAQSRAPSSVPSLPADVDMCPPQPPFDATLLSPIPDGAIDPSKLIVTLETCTDTYRTSLRTLVSRPSHLSRYMTSLLSPTSETASVYSNVSGVSSPEHSNNFNSVCQDHLASSGCPPPSVPNIRLFLDRPSAPYAHVLAYLRSLPPTAEQQETLPRAVRLDLGSGPISPARFESLLELRDEANHLGLVELEQLCAHDIRRFRHHLRCPVTVPIPAPTPAIGTLRGKTGSINSFHTVVEEGRVHTADSATRKSGSSSSSEHKDWLTRERGRERRPVKYEVGTPPPGWI